MDLKVLYEKEVDILSLSTGLKIATSSSVDFGLIADYGSEDGHDVVGIELLSAGKLIAPLCVASPKDLASKRQAASRIQSLKTEYDTGADILRIRSARKVEFPFDVGGGLVAYLGYEDSSRKVRYDVVGFELYSASDRLAPWFELNRAPLAASGLDSD